VGFLTNLRGLLDTPPDAISSESGEDLVRRKVRLWVCMGGKFPDGRFKDGDGEYNLRIDTRAAVRALSDWPTPVVFSGFEIGARVMTGKGLRALPETSPTRAAYLHFNGLENRESWDQTAVLYAVRGAAAYWTESEPGLALMHAGLRFAYNEWIPTPRKAHRYLIEKMPPAEVARVIEDLMLRPPKRWAPEARTVSVAEKGLHGGNCRDDADRDKSHAHGAPHGIGQFRGDQEPEAARERRARADDEGDLWGRKLVLPHECLPGPSQQDSGREPPSGRPAGFDAVSPIGYL
jgi:hypothetical protein